MSKKLLLRNVLIPLSAVGLAVAMILGLSAAARQSIAQTRAKETAKAERPEAPGGDEESAGLRQLLQNITKAYNQGDANALADLFQTDAVLIDTEGVEIKGREAILAHYKNAFADGAPVEISGTLKSTRFPTKEKNIASVHGEFHLHDANGGTFANGRFGMLAAREKDAWKIAELRDHWIEHLQTSARIDHLRDLEWMVGDWLDESPDLRVVSNVRWGENHNFLIRTYTIHAIGQVPSSATQWIGWDPRTKQIKSWIFDSEGGFGEGFWTRTNDGWIIKTNGTLPDGGSTSATIIIDAIAKNTVQVRSVDRIVDGEIHPDMQKMVMVRQPPAPGSARPAPLPGQAANPG